MLYRYECECIVYKHISYSISSRKSFMSKVDFLAQLQDDFKTQFHKEKSLLSFDEYLTVVQNRPQSSLRDAAHYLRDIFDYFGTTDIQKPYGKLKRFQLFDQMFDQVVDLFSELFFEH